MGRHNETKKIGGRRLNDETKWRVIFLKKNGKLSNRQIAACCKISPSTVTNLWEKYNETGSVNERNDLRTGAPRKTTPKQDRALVRASERDRFKTAPQHRRDFIAQGPRLSVSTIKRRLKEGNMNGRVARKKPLISEVNAQARLKYALSKRHWTADQWLKVMWSDESRFSLFPKCGKVYVRRRPGEEFHRQCLKPTVKRSGGSIMVWGCVSGAGMGKLKRLQGKLDTEAYYRILRHQMGPSMKLQGGRESFIFMQDNAHVHTAKKNLQFLERNNYNLLDHPAQSSDLNPLENIWWAIEQALLDLPLPSNANDLFEKIEQIWNYPTDKLLKYIKSMPSRIEAVIQAKGWHTKY